MTLLIIVALFISAYGAYILLVVKKYPLGFLEHPSAATDINLSLLQGTHDVRGLKFRRSLFGYNPDQVNEVLHFVDKQGTREPRSQ
ncbi:MAG: hypothetical protein QM632_00945 [Micrococcaceae bacterium]